MLFKKQKNNKEQPTLIEVKTVIGYGSPNKSASSASHGAPLGTDEVKLTKEYYEWDHEPFCVPGEVYTDFKEKIMDHGQQAEKEWEHLFSQYETNYPQEAEQLKLAINGKLPENWEKQLSTFEPNEDTLATRASSGKILNEIAEHIPYFIGGSADLASSNKTMIENESDFSTQNYAGRNIWFGVREHAMGAALNGMALHGGVRVYGGTFFVFSDYLRPAIRMSAIMHTPVTYVFTHDSIAVGEDGPTHEPIEQLASLRAMPNLSVIRPADGNETQAAWRLALESTTQPTVLVLTRQNLPTLDGTKEKAYEGVKRGAYVISKAGKDIPDALLLATGSEVQLAIKAQKKLKSKDIDVSVVSMPSWDRFDKQEKAYKNEILPENVTHRVAIEMGSPLGWEKYTGNEGIIMGINTFGASANGEKVMEEYGFTVDNVVSKVEKLVKQ